MISPLRDNKSLSGKMLARIAVVLIAICTLIGCAAPLNLRHKEETNKYGAKIEYTYYLAEDGGEVRHGWYHHTMPGFSIKMRYKHGKLMETQGSSSTTDPWSLDDLDSEDNKKQNKSDMATPRKPSD